MKDQSCRVRSAASPQADPEGLSTCEHTHTHIMVVKNISITKEAYEALQRQKRHNESFTEIILRLTERSGRLADSFGTWKMTDEEEKTMKRELSKGWKQSTERLKREVS